MPEELSIDTWKKTYISNFPLIDVSDLSKASFTDSHPPLTQVPRGRLKKERLRKGKIQGPKREAAAQAIIKSDDEVRGHYSYLMVL